MFSALEADLRPKIIQKRRFHAIVLSAILFVLISKGTAKAQDQGYSEQVKRNQYLNPSNMVEKDRFVRQVIGHTGDLNLSIKLMNIPGRNQLDYPLLAKYQAGIRVDLQASMIGLGWHLDLGGVRRIYRTMPDYVNTHMGDRFSLSTPEGAFRFSNYGTSSTDFKFDRWNSWKIECQSFSPTYVSGDNCYRSDALPQDFSKFIVTSNEGIKYVYALALKKGEYLQGCTSLNAPYVGNAEWLLTAILSADYVDGGGADPYNPLDSSSPLSDNGGSWIAIEYSPIRNLHYEFPGHESIMLPLLTQVTVPYQIITPTHVAQFEVEDRHQNYLSYYERKSNNAPTGYAFPDNTDYERQKRIKNIKLYPISNYNIATHTIISPGASIEEVHFEYASPSNSLAPSTLVTPNSDGKTTLTKIHLKGANGSTASPPFEFEYYVDPADFVSSINQYNPKIWLDASGTSSINTARDYLNYYENGSFVVSVDEAKAWSLKKIKFPLGGSEEYDYENDKAPVLNSGILNAGGVRLISVTVSNGMSTPAVTQYSYGTNGDGVGYLTSHPVPCLNCVAPPVPPFYLTVNNAIDHYIAYAVIEEVLPNNNGKIRRYYTSTYDWDQFVSYASNSYMRMRLSLDYQRGLLYKEEYFDNVNNFSKVVEQNYGYDTMAQRWATFGTVCSGCTFEVDRSVFVKLNSTTTKDYSIYSQSDFVTTIVSYDEYNPTNGMLRKKTETNSDGAKRITKFKYPVDYATAGTGDDYEKAIHAMRTTKHMYSPVIEKEIREQPSGQSEKVIAAELVKYKQFSSAQYLPHEIKAFSNPTAVTDFVESNIAGGNFNSDTRYQLKTTSEAYDIYGNLTLSKDAMNPATPTTTVWAYNSSLPIGRVHNASPSQVAVSVFDDNDATAWSSGTGAWVIENGIYKQTDGALTTPWSNPKRIPGVNLIDAIFEADVLFEDNGNPRYLGLAKYVDANNLIRFELRRTASMPHKVRIYAKKNGVDESIEADKPLSGNRYHLRGEIQGSVAKLYVDGELLITYDHTNVAISSGKIGLCTYATIASFDNLRFYPPNALATSISYDPGFFKIKTKSDENGNSRSFSYDNFGRLQSVTDALGRTVQEHSYFYSNPFSASNPNYMQTTLSTHAVHAPNYDFEDGGSNPSFWFAIPSGGTATWDQIVAYSGAKSLQASILSPGAGN